MTEQLLTLVRHAKSSWKSPTQTDYERPLNERGLRDAPVMAERLRQRKCIPDLLLSSSAVRAKQTASYLREAFQLATKQFLLFDELYLASADTLLRTLSDVDDDIQHVMIVAHNPGLEDLCNRLAAEALPAMPTLGVRQFQCPGINQLINGMDVQQRSATAAPRQALEGVTLRFADSPAQRQP